MPEETEVITPTATEPAAQESFEERGMKFVESQMQQADGAAVDSATGEAAVTPEADPAAEAKPETPAVETKTEPEPEPFTAEQMRDPKFFDRLDKDGWDRLQKLHPALYEMGKAVASARGKAYAQLKNQPPDPSPERTDAKPAIDEKLKAAFLKKQSLDPDEAFEGEQEFARLTIEKREQEKAEAAAANARESAELYSNAYEVALAELSDLSAIPNEELDAVVENSPKMMRALNAALRHPEKEQRTLLVADVMVDAGRVVLAKRQAAATADDQKKAADKKAADQARLRSNERNPSTAIVDTPSGKAPGGPKTFDKDGLDFISSQLTAAAPVR